MLNTNLTLLASASRTTTQTSADQTNTNYQGIHLTVDVTVAAASPSITAKIQGRDANGIYYDLLVGSAIVATGTNVLKLFPGASPVANGVANDFLPAVWRVIVTANNANAGTYSVGACLVGM